MRSKQRLYDWTKAVLIVLAVGPPIGGLAFGLVLSVVPVLNGPDEWKFVPATVIASMVMSYVLGLPIAAVAIVLLLMLSRFTTCGTVYLAVLCGVVSAALVIILAELISPPVPARLQMTWNDFVIRLGVFNPICHFRLDMLAHDEILAPNAVMATYNVGWV